MTTKLRYFSISIVCWSSMQAFAEPIAAESIALARMATRCSIIMGMESGAAKDEHAKVRMLNIQRSLIQVAPKLGADRNMMKMWLAEFDLEFQEAMGPKDAARRVQDPTFIPHQIDVCETLLRENGKRFMDLMTQ
jgi:hypothetical protein